MNNPKYLYIAGPFSIGDMMLNIRAAMMVAGLAVLRGWIPFIPHLTGFWHMLSPRSYQEWLDYDLAWLAKCDAVLRITGESPGADREVKEAMRLNIPVYLGIDQLPPGGN